jgi:hypothetical protein
MGKLMLTVKLDPERATLADASRELGVAEEELDPDFGVVNIDPDEDLFTVLVDEKTAERAEGKAAGGPYANPPIEPFGPPEPES